MNLVRDRVFFECDCVWMKNNNSILIGLAHPRCWCRWCYISCGVFGLQNRKVRERLLAQFSASENEFISVWYVHLCNMLRKLHSKFVWFYNTKNQVFYILFRIYHTLHILYYLFAFLRCLLTFIKIFCGTLTFC